MDEIVSCLVVSCLQGIAGCAHGAVKGGMVVRGEVGGVWSEFVVMMQGQSRGRRGSRS